MHDPDTLIGSLSIPIPFTKDKWTGKMKRFELLRIWHRDPCKDGSDDSCGRFMRSRHGNKECLERIIKRFEDDWDNTWQKSEEDHKDDLEEYGRSDRKIYNCGFFCPKTGEPQMSCHAIALNLYSSALVEFFVKGRREYGKVWKQVRKYMRKHMFNILHFAENPTDSLRDSILQTFGKADRRARMHSIASMIYGDILRTSRPWYKNPDLHIHHWKIYFPLLQQLKRLLFQRCRYCKKSLGFYKSVCSERTPKGTEYTCYRCDNVGSVSKEPQ